MKAQADKSAKRQQEIKADLERAHAKSKALHDKKTVKLGTNSGNPWGATHSHKAPPRTLALHNKRIIKAGLEMATAAHNAAYAAAVAQAAFKECRKQLFKKQIIIIDKEGQDQLRHLENRRKSSGLGMGVNFGMINRIHKMAQKKMHKRNLAMIGWRNFYDQAEEESNWDLVDLAQHCCAELNDHNDTDWSHRKIVMDIIEEHLNNVVHTGNKVIDKLSLAQIDKMDVLKLRAQLKKRELSEAGIHKELKARLLEWHADYYAENEAEAREKVVAAFKILFDVLVECKIDPPGPGTAEWWSTAYGVGNDDDFGEDSGGQLVAHEHDDDGKHDKHVALAMANMAKDGGGTTLANGRHTTVLQDGEAASAPKLKQLKVFKMSASGLAKADGMFGKSDPYVKILLDGKEVGRTSVKKNQLDPVWEGESIAFDLPAVLSSARYVCMLHLEIYDHDKLGGHEFLGMVDVRPEEFPKLGGSPLHSVSGLQPKEGASKKASKYVKGELTFEMAIEE
jgi:hypothetical protein